VGICQGSLSPSSTSPVAASHTAEMNLCGEKESEVGPGPWQRTVLFAAAVTKFPLPRLRGGAFLLTDFLSNRGHGGAVFKTQTRRHKRIFTGVLARRP